jgi:putative flippase GtrA
MLHEIKRLLKFSSVGLVSTTVHACVFSFVYEVYAIDTILSNIIAFFIALGVSYLGHNYFTFRDRTQHTKPDHALRIRFFLTALSGLMLNIFWAYLFIDIMQWNIMVYNIGGLYILTPLSAYLLHRIWVYGNVAN